ncbi:hypothetical protein JMJ35_010399 [Cladonia borealis]|uniref:Methyltransferase n=1 Tax=Cladonia borealis TaxID=184061 RepID=A0AA39QRZ6_9LECA|nr:hypothetical protein JMJ35_010399 [Cladonia borealis]
MIMTSERYAFGRDYAESTRLVGQHHLWKETLGYLTHPSILLDSECLRIADVGTGTGIWLFDLAKYLLPSTQLDGFDISSAGYPHESWLPNNVSLKTWNAFEEPHESYLGRYDLVHLRLFQIAIDNNDPSLLLQNCIKLLKPGGVIQWEEYDLNAQKIVASNASVTTDNLKAFAETTRKQKNCSWVSDLPRAFEHHGLTHLSVSRLHEHRWHTRALTEMNLVLADNFANHLDMPDSPGSANSLRQLAKRVYAEVEQGAGIEQTLQVVIGRKAFLAERET